MPAITDTPPADTREELTRLRRQLTRDVPRKSDDNLLIATWNIREFGGLTEKWRATSSDTPKRDLHSLLCISEIVSRFDIVAVQEAQKSLEALREMLRYLGDRWGVILTDPTEDDLGDDERLAFVFDRERVEVAGLACELVVPFNWNRDNPNRRIPQQALERQFARTPYAVTFKRDDAIFTLVALHIFWGSKSAQDIAARGRELTAIATWLRDWAADPDTWDSNLICMGDFNIDRRGSTLWQAFTSTGLTVPEQIDRPRVIAGRALDHYYDQIAWFTADDAGTQPLLSLRNTGRGGMFDWSETVLATTNLTSAQKSFRMSDHFPLWVEFDVP